MDAPLTQRVRSVGAWLGCVGRFLWSIPKAIFKGDSRGMLDALGELLSRSSSQQRSQQAAPHQPVSDPPENSGASPGADGNPS